MIRQQQNSLGEVLSITRFQNWLCENVFAEDKNSFLVFYTSYYAGSVSEDYHAVFINYSDALDYVEVLKNRIEKNSVIKDQEKLNSEFLSSGVFSQSEFIDLEYCDGDTIEIEIWDRKDERIYWTGAVFDYDDSLGFYISWLE